MVGNNALNSIDVLGLAAFNCDDPCPAPSSTIAATRVVKNGRKRTVEVSNQKMDHFNRMLSALRTF
jgi:hypothetical protein